MKALVLWSWVFGRETFLLPPTKGFLEKSHLRNVQVNQNQEYLNEKNIIILVPKATVTKVMPQLFKDTENCKLYFTY